MQNFKKRWEIQKNWQLLFPFLGIVLLLYSSYKLASIFFNRASQSDFIFLILSTLILYYLLLKLTLWIFKKLENKWIVKHRWEMIRIFIVFAITGSSSVFVGRPIIKLLGITKDNLNVFVYWFLYIIIGLIFYQILLVIFGWLFGQYQFFWNFEKKMLRRFGFKRFLKD